MGIRVHDNLKSNYCPYRAEVNGVGIRGESHYILPGEICRECRQVTTTIKEESGAESAEVSRSRSSDEVPEREWSEG